MMSAFYYLVPIFLFGFWVSNTLGLLLLWIHDESPRYRSNEARINFLSDIGAAHKTYFIIFSTLTAAFYVAAVFVERHLRQLHGNMLSRQLYFDMVMTYCASIGAAALIALSIFDAFNFANAHWSLGMFSYSTTMPERNADVFPSSPAIVFVVGVSISTFLQTLETWHLSRHSKGHSGHLFSLAVIKTILLSTGLLLLAAYVGLYASCGGLSNGKGKCEIITSIAGGIEWALSAILALYFLTFPWDSYCARQFESSKKAKKKLRYSTFSLANPLVGEKVPIPDSYLKTKNVPPGGNILELDGCRSRSSL